MKSKSCLFCGRAPREDRRLCDVCMGLDESMKIEAAASAIQAILERPSGRARPGDTGTSRRGDGETRRPGDTAPKRERQAKQTVKIGGRMKVRRTRKVEPKPRKRRQKQRDPRKLETVSCIQCGSDFKKWKSHGVVRCSDCREANRLKRLKE